MGTASPSWPRRILEVTKRCPNIGTSWETFEKGKIDKKSMGVCHQIWYIYIYISYSHPGVEHGHWWQFSDVFRCLLYLLQDEQISVYIYIYTLWIVPSNSGMEAPKIKIQQIRVDGSALQLSKNGEPQRKCGCLPPNGDLNHPTWSWPGNESTVQHRTTCLVLPKRLSTDQILSEVVQQKSFPLLCRSRILTLSNRWGRISYLTWAWQWCPKYGIWRVILKEKKMIS